METWSLPLDFKHFCRNFAFVSFSSSKMSLSFFMSNKNFFLLSMVNLQCHVSFKCIAKWISYVCAQSLSLVRFFVTPWATVHGVSQARILEWVACPAPGDLPDPGIEPTSPASPAMAGICFTTEPSGKPNWSNMYIYPFFFWLFSYISCYRVLRSSSCAI